MSKERMVGLAFLFVFALGAMQTGSYLDALDKSATQALEQWAKDDSSRRVAAEHYAQNCLISGNDQLTVMNAQALSNEACFASLEGYGLLDAWSLASLVGEAKNSVQRPLVMMLGAMIINPRIFSH